MILILFSYLILLFGTTANPDATAFAGIKSARAGIQ
jgi:hypothetical protein